ncbi:hypothetical protein [Paenibacillus sp. S25]|uniref:hypothetical protein n=1 Tax=Paenibacillus sp. S25 TaxID=2823905 RepID=UPI001C65067D|nr:hypothetical protein [Paenibacillus sp. S25]QYK63069.1 hypothetical protein KAI37_03400 [Paenibacillus sp. S25]
MMNILFWNVGKLEIDNSSIIEDLLISSNCDIASFAEYRGDYKTLLRNLSEKGQNYYHVPIIGCERINIFTKILPEKVKPLSETNYFTLKQFPHPKLVNLTIAFVRFPSKLYSDDFDYLEESRLFRLQIEQDEEHLNNENTIVIGDFNMNPFEKGMLAASAFHAVPTIFEAKKGKRLIKGREYKMFYNPMWNFFGDLYGHQGTYYYSQAKHFNVNWNILDQVIIRPVLLEYLDLSKIQIITEVNGETLIKQNGTPLTSDHLPIYFEI